METWKNCWCCVTFAGNPITLKAQKFKVGQQAPDFTVLSNDLQLKL